MIERVEDIILLLRPLIALNAEMDLDDIINIDSIRGVELTKIENGKKVPYEPYETVIAFELVENNNIDINETYEKDNLVHSVSSYDINLVIYGDEARTISKKLRARILSEKVRGDLAEQGISLIDASSIEPTTEMINSVRYIRRDFTITIVAELKFELLDDYEEIDSTRLNETKTS